MVYDIDVAIAINSETILGRHRIGSRDERISWRGTRRKLPQLAVPRVDDPDIVVAVDDDIARVNGRAIISEFPDSDRRCRTSRIRREFVDAAVLAGYVHEAQAVEGYVTGITK